MLQFYSRCGLRTKLALIFVVPAALIIGLLFLLFQWNLNRAIDQQYVDDGLAISSVVNQQLTFGGELPDKETMERFLLQGLEQRPQYTQLAIYDTKGQRLALVSTKTPIIRDHSIDPDFLRVVMSGKSSYEMSNDSPIGTDAVLEVINPIVVGNRILAVFESYRPLGQIVGLMRQVMVVGPLGIGCLVAIIFVGVNVLIIRPVRRLGSASQQIETGDYRLELPVSGNDELAMLARTFNQMARSIDVAMKELQQKREALEISYQQSQILAVTDGLTGLNNHREFQRRLEEEVERSLRYHHSISLLLLDIDYFKQINDRYGHQTGDAILKILAETIRAGIRTSDIAARYGGEEFAVILPETQTDGAKVVADRLRTQVERHEFADSTGRRIPYFISIGMAVFPEDADGRERFIEAADKALYYAKSMGRNVVKSYQEFLQAEMKLKSASSSPPFSSG